MNIFTRRDYHVGRMYLDFDGCALGGMTMLVACISGSDGCCNFALGDMNIFSRRYEDFHSEGLPCWLHIFQFVTDVVILHSEI